LFEATRIGFLHQSPDLPNLHFAGEGWMLEGTTDSGTQPGALLWISTKRPQILVSEAIL